ncbi:hypothetical protein DFH06DRAFT_1325070 [Mycena polygramma]|nr:hypothetical protein DFH06DRAFT_1325070 [Mycena polygramma]
MPPLGTRLKLRQHHLALTSTSTAFLRCPRPCSLLYLLFYVEYPLLLISRTDSQVKPPKSKANPAAGLYEHDKLLLKPLQPVPLPRHLRSLTFFLVCLRLHCVCSFFSSHHFLERTRLPTACLPIFQGRRLVMRRRYRREAESGGQAIHRWGS